MVTVLVVGGGLAGCEAAWQLAAAGVAGAAASRCGRRRRTPAHRTGDLAELVCSNSLRSDNPSNAVGLLKREMEAMGSLVMAAARADGAAGRRRAGGRPRRLLRRRSPARSSRPPADRGRARARSPRCPTGRPSSPPARSPRRRFTPRWQALLGEGSLSFFDAIAPVVASTTRSTMSVLFRASRYGKGGGADYLNAPLDRGRVRGVRGGAAAPPRRCRSSEFERDIPYFEGCLPIEVMAERGLDTLRYGPMKPVGLRRPAHRPAAVRRGPAPPGRPRGRALEPGRLPDPHDRRRPAATCCASSPGSSRRASPASAWSTATPSCAPRATSTPSCA